MSADAVPNAVEQIPDATHPAGVGLIKPGYEPKLTNQDLAPLHRQKPRSSARSRGAPAA